MSMVCWLLKGVATTSTSFIMVAGLKKCIPAIRCGFTTFFAISVTDNEDVLVAKTTSLWFTSDSWLNKLTFISGFSTMASITRSARQSLVSEANFMRLMMPALASAVSLFFC